MRDYIEDVISAQFDSILLRLELWPIADISALFLRRCWLKLIESWAERESANKSTTEMISYRQKGSKSKKKSYPRVFTIIHTRARCHGTFNSTISRNRRFFHRKVNFFAAIFANVITSGRGTTKVSG